MTDRSAHGCLFETAIGVCGIAWRGNLVVGTQLPEGSSNATRARLLVRHNANEAEPPAEIQQVITAIANLMSGERIDLNEFECDFSSVDSFARSVYAATRAIPPGETTTYGAIAEALGDKQLARGVGQALGRNPLPIIVPCHRVLGANNKLVGFSAQGGTEMKLKMLGSL